MNREKAKVSRKITGATKSRWVEVPEWNEEEGKLTKVKYYLKEELAKMHNCSNGSIGGKYLGYKIPFVNIGGSLFIKDDPRFDKQNSGFQVGHSINSRAKNAAQLLNMLQDLSNLNKELFEIVREQGQRIDRLNGNIVNLQVNTTHLIKLMPLNLADRLQYMKRYIQEKKMAEDFGNGSDNQKARLIKAAENLPQVIKNPVV